MVKYIAKYLSIFSLLVSTVFLIALQLKFLGWIILFFGALSLFFCEKKLSKYFFLIYISVAILGVTSISTSISYTNFMTMGTLLGLAIAIPYTTVLFAYKDSSIKFKFHHGRNWRKAEIGYIFLTAIIAYLLLPFMLYTTNSYKNWTVDPQTTELIKLFIGTNALGIWDEIFFVSTVLGILRKFLNFTFANFSQAVIFTSFLYELGFRGWGFIIIFIFALIQGFIFKKTESLFYVITIHLTLDLILYLVLIHLHHPDWLGIFLT